MRNLAVEQMLESLKGKSVVEQLRERGIGALKKRHYPDTFNARGQLTPFTTPAGYMTIEVNARDPFEEWLMTVGHELGHTFVYGIPQDDEVVPFELWPKLTKRERRLLKKSLDWRVNAYIGYKHERSEEKLCERFAEAWLKQGSNRHELEELLQQLVEREKVYL
ncbi:MAG: hypothetical protein HY001_03710 [Candidatus Portnoybacteria bacterium]|nr:hypothetical protein [Candidatus Portnoybacteria bacterium]